jgi:MATE family multidrug resistance protein
VSTVALAQSGLRERRAWTGEIRATLSLAWPLVLTNLGLIGLGAMDVMLLGRLGPEPLGAGALGTNLYFALAFLGIGLTSATAPLLADELGRRRHAVKEVRRTVRQGLWACLGITLPIWVVLWNGDIILRALGQDPALAAAAGAYLRALQWGLLPFLGFQVLRFFLSALERPGWALAVMLAALPVNFVLAYGLIYGRLGLPEIGLIGAGVATSITNLFSFAALAAVVAWDPRFRRYRLFGRVWRADWPRFRRLWGLGLPIAATLAFEAMIFNAAAFAMGTFGTAPLAAHAVAIQIASVTFMVPLGVAQAATVRVGLAAGARDPDGVKRAGWTALALGTGFMAAVAMVMLAAPGPIVGLFLDRANPANAPVLELAISFLLFAAIFQVADGAQAVGAGMLRGLQDTRVPMLYAGLGYWGIGASLGVALAFGAGLGGRGLWIGLATGLTVVAVLMLHRWTRRDRLGLGPPEPSPRRPAPSPRASR